MPSTTKKVEQYLEGDLVFERALARGILSVRRAARWMIDHNGWEVTEEAVVSALRRYTPKHPEAMIEDGYALLRGARTGLTTDRALVAVSNLGSTRGRVRRAIYDICEDGNRVGVLQGSDTVNFFVTEEVAQRVREKYPRSIEEIIHPVSRLHISFRREDPAKGAALAILLNTFSYRGIGLLELFSSGCEHSFLVRGKFTSEAHDVFLHLRGDTGELE